MFALFLLFSCLGLAYSGFQSHQTYTYKLTGRVTLGNNTTTTKWEISATNLFGNEHQSLVLLKQSKCSQVLEDAKTLKDCTSSNGYSLFVVTDSENRIQHLYTDATTSTQITWNSLFAFAYSFLGVEHLSAADGWKPNFVVLHAELEDQLTDFTKTSSSNTVTIRANNLRLHPQHTRDRSIDLMDVHYGISAQLTINDIGYPTAGHFNQSVRVATDLHDKFSVDLMSNVEMNLLHVTATTDVNGCAEETSMDQCIAKLHLQPIVFHNLQETVIQPSSLHAVVGIIRDRMSTNDEILLESSADFITLSNVLRSSNLTETESVLADESNHVLAGTLVDALATSITAKSVKTIRKLLAKYLPDSLERYAASLGQTMDVNEKIVRQLIDWAEETPDERLEETILLTTGVLIGRLVTISKNKAKADHELILNRVLSAYGKRAKSSQAANVMLASLGNTRLPEVLPIINTYICTDHGSSINQDALMALGQLPTVYWTKETIHLLVNTFRNACGVAVDESTKALAGTLLLDVATRERSVAAVVYNWFISEVQPDSQQTEETRSFMLSRFTNRFTERHRKAFALDWNRAATKALSLSHTGLISDLDNTKAHYDLDMEFSSGLLKRSHFRVDVVDVRGNVRPLLEVLLFSEGLESALGVADQPTSDVTYAGIQLGVLGGRQRPMRVIDGASQLMSAVFSADGTAHTAVEGNFITSQSAYTIPLATGMHYILRKQSAATIRTTGAIEISLWSRTSHTEVITAASYSLNVHAAVEGVVDKQIVEKRELSLAGAVPYITDVDFSGEPLQMCPRMEQLPIKMRLSVNDHLTFRRIPARTFSSHLKLLKMCNDMQM